MRDRGKLIGVICRFVIITEAGLLLTDVWVDLVEVLNITSHILTVFDRGPDPVAVRLFNKILLSIT
jgi:hypothetical protein